MSNQLQPVTSQANPLLLQNNTTTAAAGQSTATGPAFLQELETAMVRQWMVSLLSDLPLPGMSDGVTSDMGTGNSMTSLAGPSASDFVQLFSMLAGANGVSPLANLNETEASAPATAASTTTDVSAASIRDAVQAASLKYNVPEPLITSVIMQESGMDPKAVSSAGAIGLMQLMPGTAKSLGVDPWDPAQNIDGGTHYLANMLNAFHGDVRLALAAYNAGPGAVRQYNGVPPYPETQAYVERVLERAKAAGLSM